MGKAFKLVSDAADVMDYLWKHVGHFDGRYRCVAYVGSELVVVSKLGITRKLSVL